MTSIKETKEKLSEIADLEVLDRDPETKNVEKTKKPPLYRVLLHNNDYVAGEIVATVLKTVFHITDEQGWQIMMAAHQHGVAVVTVFTKDIAETKISEAQDALIHLGGEDMNFPIFSLEPEDDGDDHEE